MCYWVLKIILFPKVPTEFVIWIMRIYGCCHRVGLLRYVLKHLDL